MVTMTDLDGKNPREVTAMVYLMNDGNRINPPSMDYYYVLAEGYKRFGFNTYNLDLPLTEAKEAGR